MINIQQINVQEDENFKKLLSNVQKVAGILNQYEGKERRIPADGIGYLLNEGDSLSFSNTTGQRIASIAVAGDRTIAQLGTEDRVYNSPLGGDFYIVGRKDVCDLRYIKIKGEKMDERTAGNTDMYTSAFQLAIQKIKNEKGTSVRVIDMEKNPLESQYRKIF